MNKMIKKRILVVEIGHTTLLLPENVKAENIPFFLNDIDLEKVISDLGLIKSSEEMSPYPIKELGIFPQRDLAVWKQGSSKTIEDFESLELYMDDMNKSPDLMKNSFYESYFFLRDPETFIKQYHYYPLSQTIFSKYIHLIAQNNPDYFRQLKSNFFLDSSPEFLQALSNEKLNLSLNFYDCTYGALTNNIGKQITHAQLSWLHKNSKKQWESIHEKHAKKQLIQLVNNKQSKRFKFLIQLDNYIRNAFLKMIKDVDKHNVFRDILMKE